MPLLHEDTGEAVAIAEDMIQSFNPLFRKTWLDMMRSKLGFLNEQQEDEQLINDLLKWMQLHQADHTNTFRDLISEIMPAGERYNTEGFQGWWQRWQSRLGQNKKPLEASFCLMRANNPAIIPRNHRVEAALTAAEKNCDYTKLHMLLDALSEPYKDKPEFIEFRHPPESYERIYQTFCGT